MDIRRILKNQKGSALLLGIGVMVLLAALVTALLPWITAESRFGRNELDGVQARYAAEAGIKRALATFAQATPSWGWLVGGAKEITNTAGQGTYNVTICKKETTSPFACLITTTPTGSGDYIITSTGMANGMTKVSKLGASFTAGGGGYATYAGGSLAIGNNTNVNSGQLGYSGSFSSGKPVDCPGSEPSNSCVINTSLPLPVYKLSDYSAATSAPLPSATLTETKYYHAGSWDVGNNKTWTGTDNTVTVIFVNGAFSSGNSFKIKSGTNGAVLLYINGSANFSNGIELDNAAVIATGAVTFGNGSPDINGFIMAGGSMTWGNSKTTVSFNEQVAKLLGLVSYTGSTTPNVTPGIWEKSNP